MSLKLFINNKPVILKEDSGIYLTYEANSLENLSQRSGTISEDSELKFCNQNRAALGNPDIINSMSNTPYEVLPSWLEVDGNFFMPGTVSIDDVQDSYKFHFTSDNSDFFRKIKGLPISAIDLTDLDHAWTAANVQAANVHDPARGYAYPLVNYGRWGSTRFYDASNQHFNELFPAVYVRTLLERMAAPYTLAGSLLTEERFNRLVVGFTNEMFRYRESYRAGFDGEVKQVTDLLIPASVAEQIISFSVVTNNPGGQIETTPYMHYLTPSFRGKYRVKVNMRVSFELAAGLTNTFSLLAKVPSGDIVPLQQLNLPAGAEQTINWDVTTVAFDPGTELYIYFSGQPNPLNREDVFFLDGATFEVQLHEQVFEGGQVHLDANLPDITQDSLLASVVNAFDVMIQTNDITKVITLDLRRDILSRPSLDWLRKIDFTRRIKTVFAQAFYGQRNVFTWAENEAKDINGTPLTDSMVIQVLNQNCEPEKDAFVSEFTHTLNAPAFRGTRTLPVIPVFRQMVESYGLYRDFIEYGNENYVYWQGNYWLRRGTATGETPEFGGPTDPGWTLVPESDAFVREGLTPRLLVMEELPAGDAISIGDNENIAGFAPVQWSAAFLTGDPGLSLQFDTLRETYYPILERILVKPKFLTLMMRLTPADITTLDFMRPVYLNRPELNLTGYFYLWKIEQYNPDEVQAVAVTIALIGTMPIEVSPVGSREHSEEYSEEYA